MYYNEYTIGGELMHYAKGSEKAGAKYIDKVKTKTGKWRYIYDTKISGKKYKNAEKIAMSNSSKARTSAAESRRKASIQESIAKANQKFNPEAAAKAENLQSKLANQAKSEDERANTFEKQANEANANYRESLAGRVDTLLEKIQKKKKK